MREPGTQAVVAIAVVLGFALVFGAANSFGVFSAETASWVQALGSIGAVTGAAWIANRQFREARDREDRDRLAARQAAEDSLAATRGVAAALLSQVKTRLVWLAELARAEHAERLNGYALKAVHVACAALSRFPCETLQSAELIEHFGRAEGWLMVCVQYAEDRRGEIDKASDLAERRRLLIKVADQLQDSATRLDEVIERLKAG